MVNSRRYAHVECFEKHQKEKSKEELDKEELEKYIKQLFNINKLSVKIQKQIDKFVKENNYSYSGIKRSLIYFYEIKKNSLDKANDGIGIVPYVYQEAYQYYYNLWIAQQKNINKELIDYQPRSITITIKPPQRKIKKRNLFNFLDSEEEENN